jgi:hypothetical protein
MNSQAGENFAGQVARVQNVKKKSRQKISAIAHK